MAWLGAGIATSASAQSYPDKPIKMIVPFPPGGPIDTMARLTGQSMSASLGQQVIVENRPGAGSTIGFKAAAAAEPDGYTLLFGSSGSLGVAPALYPSLDVDPLKYFTTVATTSLLPHIMVVGPDVPAKTVAEFVAYAKANPGKLNYGAGLGTPPHLLVDPVQDPGRARRHLHSLQGLGAVGDRPDRRADPFHHRRHADPHSAGQGRQASRARGRPRPERWPDLPDVPTLVESGYPDFVIDAWTGVMAPKGTPPQIVARLNAVINDGLKTDGDQDRPRPLPGAAEGQHAAGVRGVPEGPTAEMGLDGEARRRQG